MIERPQCVNRVNWRMVALSRTAPASHAEKNINQPNELLEVQHGSETMDTRTAGAAIGKDKAMAAVG
jgi:hypothetical protein